MLKAFLNVRTVRSAQLVEKGFLIGGWDMMFSPASRSHMQLFAQYKANNCINRCFCAIVALKNDEQLHTIHFRSHA